MPKRSASDALQAVVPAPKVGDVGLKSRSGRVVKPKVWDDGTLAAPLAALKDDAGEAPAERMAASDAADPDYSHENSEERASAGQRPTGTGESEEEEEPYSDGSPRASADGSQGGGSMGRARSGSVGRDEHGKFVAGPRGPRGPRGGRGARGEGGGGIFKMAAVEVLRLEKRLMSTGEIARVALKRGLIKCTGKTPEATMASALYTDIKRKEGQSIFIRPHEGLFGLREWIEQGVAFQDEFAEEMAKRARAAFGAFVAMPGMPPMMPPMMDSDGVPIPNPYAPMMPFHGMPPMPGMPPLGMPPMVPGMPPPPPVPAPVGKAVADDSPDGLMELLSAAEELHKTSSQEKEEADVKYTADGSTAKPAAAEAPAAAAASAQPAAATAAAATAAPMETDQAATSNAATDGDQAAATAATGEAQPQASAGAGPASAAAAAAGASSQNQGSELAGDEEDDAAAMLAAVAEAAAEEPRHEVEAAHRHPGFPGFPGLGDAAAPMPGGMPYHPMQYPAPYGYPPYGYYPHPYMYPQPPHAAAATTLPPLPKQPRGKAGVYGDAADMAAAAAADLAGMGPADGMGEAAGIELEVRGSNRPFVAAAAAGGLRLPAATLEMDGQEQVNILNLPLPELDTQANPSGRGGEGAGEPPAAQQLEPAQLKEAEAQVMRLEKELGTSHPEVGKAYLSLSRLYLAGCEESSSKKLAVAALSRAYEVMSVCQLALKRQPSCASSFTYLMDKIRTAQSTAQQRPLGTPAAHGEAAHLSLPAAAGGSA